MITYFSDAISFDKSGYQAYRLAEIERMIQVASTHIDRAVIVIDQETYPVRGEPQMDLLQTLSKHMLQMDIY